MKVTRSQWILVTAACLIVAASAAQSGADLPPGADGNNWVPISDTAGILLTKFDPSGVTWHRQFDDVQTLVPMSGTGILMVKFGGIWMRVNPELPPPRVQPLN
jgi:hypothetical protein